MGAGCGQGTAGDAACGGEASRAAARAGKFAAAAGEDHAAGSSASSFAELAVVGDEVAASSTG